jgi:hypothetical protein
VFLAVGTFVMGIVVHRTWEAIYRVCGVRYVGVVVIGCGVKDG